MYDTVSRWIVYSSTDPVSMLDYVFVVQYHHIQKWNTKIYNLMKMIYFYSLFLLSKNVNILCHHASDYTHDVRILKSMGKE